MRPAALVLSLALAPCAAAVPSFNVDFGRPDHPAPADDHEGAARQPGRWNVVSNLEPDPVPLVDVDGVATDVTIAFSLPFGPASFDHEGTEGDHDALLDDYLDLRSVPATMEVHGLPKGTYALVTYAWAPDSAAFETFVSVNGHASQRVGGKWPGDYERRVTHAVHHGHVRDGEPVTVLLFGLPKGTLNGLQIVGLSENP